MSSSSAAPSSQSPQARGALIVFEGLDRSGKSTQHARVLDHLRQEGKKVEGMRFPDRTTATGKLIDEYLRGETELDDHVVHLLFSANRWEVSTRLETLLYSGTTILLDRYHHSGAVYSAAKHNALLDLDWARAPDINLPAPDLVIFLDVSAQRAAERGGFGGERYEESEMQSRVRELFRVVGERERMEGRVRWEVVDAGRGVEEVSKEVVELVGQCLEMVQRDGGRPLLRIAR